MLNTEAPIASPGFCDNCVNSLCPAGSQCTGDVCRPVECGINVACARTTDFCDLWVNACYPSNGGCASASDCPHFDGSILRAGELKCQEGFCRLGPLPPAQVPELEGSDLVEVLAPTHGAQYSSVDDLRLDWSGPRADAIVLILKDVPKTPGEVLALAVWGASVPADQTASLRIEDGVEIIYAEWSTTHGTGLPENTPLYALVQLVEGARLVAISPLVPFIVGRSWKEPGDACIGPSECENPRYVQTCLEGQCRVLCSSNRDCLPWSQTCAWPEDGHRICR